MPATIHPGSVIHCWDHLVITLRDDAGVETAFLSLYAIAYSPTLGAGHVALLEIPGASGRLPGGRPNRPLVATLADDDELGDRQQARLTAMGDSRAALRVPPVKARFERIPYATDGFGFRIRTDADAAIGAHDIEASWLEPHPPFWVDGQRGGFSASEDIWAMMVGAARARLSIDGSVVPGQPFDDDVWTPKLGRSLSSAHGAFSEVRLTPVGPTDGPNGPVSGRATGTGPVGPR